MITVKANARSASYDSDDLITSGSAGIPCEFVLSSDFNGLSPIAVFEGSGTARDVALIGDSCVVPHEVLTTAGGYLRIGIYASNSAGTIVIPTVWAGSKMILQGTEPSEVDPSAPTPSWVAQVQAAAAEAVQTSEEAIEIAGGAQAAADDARESASAAAGSATAAAQSESAASGYATSASGSASAAAQSATGAAGSASNAASSASAAAGSATAAAGSAEAAAASEAAAREVEESIPEDYADLSKDVVDLKSQTPYDAETDAEDVDLDICDPDGNVVVRFKDGHIKTKEFDSSSLNSGSMVESLHASSDDDLVVTDTGGNVLMAIKDGNIKTKRFNSIIVNPNVITVKANGGGDFANLRDAIESITDANVINNPYVIEIYEGTYNILDDYTQAEIEDESFVGPMISEGMYLKGIGNRDNVVIYGYLDPDTYTNDTRNRIATLNTKSECGMENLTVVGERIRYAVHDDYVDSFRAYYGRNPVRILKNCVFVGKNTTGGASYGAGTSNARDYIIDNCLFPTERIGIHMQAGMTHSGKMILSDCSGVGFSIGDYSTSAASPKHTLIMNGCCFKWVDIYKARNGSYNAQHMRIFGTGNKNAFIYAPVGFVYQTGDVETTSVEVTLGKVVTADYSTGTAETAYGVCIGTFEGLSYIQTGGYILTSLLGLSASEGDYVGVSNGNVSIVSTQADSIGKVVTFNNETYIKLTI